MAVDIFVNDDQVDVTATEEQVTNTVIPSVLPLPGESGKDGEDGFSPVISIYAIEGGNRIDITDANGTHTVEVMDGKNGSPGQPGNGISSAVLNADYTLTLTFDDGTSYTTPSIRGATGKEGADGVSGVHIGTDTPPDTANVWVNPNGDPTSTEDWEFDLEDGSTDTKTVVVLNSDEATASGRIGILRVKNANGEWEEIPALIGRPGADGYTPVKNIDYFDGKDGKDGKDGYTPQKNVDYFDGKDGKDGYTPQKNVDYFDGAKGDTGESGVVTPVDGFYTLSVDADGNLWVTSKDGNTPNFEYDSATGNLYVVADGTNVLIGNIKGDKGDKGDPGSAGAAGSNGVSATHSWNGTTLTVTSASGTSSADLKGSKGDKGDKGDTGAAGSDASVTSANIASALGYTPANPSSIPSKTENWTFTLEDGSTVTKSIYVK